MPKITKKYFSKRNDKKLISEIPSEDNLDIGFINGNGKKKKRLNIPIIRKLMKIPGIPPGTLKYAGEKKDDPVYIDVIDFTNTDFLQKRVKNINECLKLKTKKSTTWVNVTGIHNVTIIEEIGKIFDIHPLILEDILHYGQRPKVEFHKDYIYVVMKMVYIEEDKKEVQSEQISFI